jgi:RNA polymerase sigma-70 factor, ECF subfamily
MYASTFALGLPLSDDQRMTFEASYQAFRHRVYRLGLRYGGGRESWAEDLTQDVFMKLYRELPSLTDREDLGGWIYRVTTNAALSRLRRERSVFRTVRQLWSQQDEQAQEQADTRLELSERAQEAEAMLAALPPKERVVLSMKVLDGRSQREIAGLLGLSEGYVSKLLTRSWARLQAAGWEVDDEQG